MSRRTYYDGRLRPATGCLYGAFVGLLLWALIALVVIVLVVK